MNDWKKEHEREDRRKKGNGMVKTTATESKVSVFFGVTFEEFLKLTDKDQVQAIELISRRFGVGNKALAKDFGVSREEFAKKVWDRLKLGRLSGGRQTKAQSAALQRLSDAGVGGIKIEVGKKPLPWVEDGEKVCVKPLDSKELSEAQIASNPSSKMVKTWIDLAALDDEQFCAHVNKLYKSFVDSKVVAKARLAEVLRIPTYTVETVIPSKLKERNLLSKSPRVLQPGSAQFIERTSEFDRLAMAIENRYAEQRAQLDAMSVDGLAFLKMSVEEEAFFFHAARMFYPAPTHAYARALGLYSLGDSSIDSEPGENDIFAERVIYPLSNTRLGQRYSARRHINKVELPETVEFLKKLKAATDSLSDAEFAEAQRLANARWETLELKMFGSESTAIDVLDQTPDNPEPPAPEPDSPEPAQHDGYVVLSPFHFTDEQKQTFAEQMFALLTEEQKGELLAEWLAQHPKEKEELAFAQLSERLRSAAF